MDSPLGRAGGGPPAPDGRNVDHVCLQLARFDEAALRAHLSAHGVAPGDVGTRYGALGMGPSMYIRDPDGNVIELKGPPAGEATAVARAVGRRSPRTKGTKRTGKSVSLRMPAGGALEDAELLVAAADGHDEAPAERELVERRLRHLRRRRGNDDAVEGRVLGEPAVAVAREHLDVRDAERPRASRRARSASSGTISML